LAPRKKKPTKKTPAKKKAAKKRAARSRGARPKIGRDLIEVISGAVENGTPKNQAAHLAGIHESTLYDWINKGEADIKAGKASLYRELSEAITRARAEKINKALALIWSSSLDRNMSTGMLDLKGLMWMLERTEPDLFGRVNREKVELTGRDGGAIEVNTLADVVRLAAKAEKGET